MTKTLWTYWHQGWRNAPEHVSLCLRSWSHHNPGWRIEALDAESVRQFATLDAVDIGRPDISMQKRSLFIRLELLRRHGGVWADATVYCWQPLDSWLPACARTGYFAFRDPGPDRMASSWFIASEPDHPLLVRHADAFISLFRAHIFTNQHNPATHALIAKLLERHGQDHEGTLFWTSDFALSLLKAHPYFIFHYLFNRLVLTDAEFAGLWKTARSLHADGPHLLQALAGGPAEDALARVASDPAPVHKLNWRDDTSSGYWKKVVAALAKRIEG